MIDPLSFALGIGIGMSLGLFISGVLLPVVIDVRNALRRRRDGYGR